MRHTGTEFYRMMLKKAAVEKSLLFPQFEVNFVEAKAEAVRKSIHFLIALSPTLAALNYSFTVLLLTVGIMGYAVMEQMRLSGVKIPLVSTLTSMVSRPRDMNGFVLGPITLAMGAILALLLFPPSVACICIYALAFGDGFASLVGKTFGKWRPSFLFGKSVEGSLACFTAVLVSAYAVSGNMHIAVVAAFTATIVEALPLGDYDNIALPVTVGLVVQVLSLPL